VLAPAPAADQPDDQFLIGAVVATTPAATRSRNSLRFVRSDMTRTPWVMVWCFVLHILFFET
jgi:hypothetical protein